MIRKLATVIQWTWQGCGWLGDYGYHPGTALLFSLIALGALAGLSDGIYRALFGAGVMAFFLVPIYLIGAHNRAAEYHRARKKESSK